MRWPHGAVEGGAKRTTLTLSCNDAARNNKNPYCIHHSHKRLFTGRRRYAALRTNTTTNKHHPKHATEKTQPSNRRGRLNAYNSAVQRAQKTKNDCEVQYIRYDTTIVIVIVQVSGSETLKQKRNALLPPRQTQNLSRQKTKTSKHR